MQKITYCSEKERRKGNLVLKVLGERTHSGEIHFVFLKISYFSINKCTLKKENYFFRDNVLNVAPKAIKP